MSKYHQAADTLKREAQRYAALNEAAKALDEIGSLDQAANEAKARAIANQKEADDIKAEVAKLKAGAERIKADQAAKQKEAEDIYARSIAEANAKHSEIVADAIASAEKIKAEAQGVAQYNKQVIEGQIANMEATKILLQNDIAALTQDALTSNTEAEAAEKRLLKVRENIAKLATA